jgi:2-polyprenyl-3-methyl-5-hydroxy-6-metoxy-1,4-benzoquinol methylase
LRTARSAFQLGRCNTAELERRTIAYYEQGTPFDEAHYLAQGLQGWEVDAICKHFPSKGRILLAAAGGGRESRALEAMGYEVASFDPSDRLVNRFRELTNDGRKIVRSTPTAVPRFKEEFDAAIVGWGGYTHIPERTRRVVFLRALTAQMKQNAPLLLSFFLRHESPWRSKTCATAANLIRRVRRLEPVVEPGDTMTDKFEHHFLREEVVAELTAGGLKLAEFRPAPFPHAIGVVR